MGRIKKSIKVDAPIEETYRFWIDFEQFPTFVSHLEHIRRKGAPNVLRWEMRGPKGEVLEWDVELDAVKHQNHVISWHTIRDASVPHSGAITLEPAGEKSEQTQLHVVIDYALPGEVEASCERYLEESLTETLVRAKEKLEEQHQKAKAGKK